MLYTITAEKLQSLLYAETMLDELSSMGVDNWEGYSEIDWDAIRAAEQLPAELPKGIAVLDDEPPTVSPPAGFTTRAPGD